LTLKTVLDGQKKEAVKGEEGTVPHRPGKETAASALEEEKKSTRQKGERILFASRPKKGDRNLRGKGRRGKGGPAPDRNTEIVEESIFS